jgi:hypothetical protein
MRSYGTFVLLFAAAASTGFFAGANLDQSIKQFLA